MKYSDGLGLGRKSRVWVGSVKHRFMNEFWNKKDSLIILFHIAKLVVDRKVPFLNFDHVQYVFCMAKLIYISM